MVIPRSVGVSPGTTTLRLGAPPSARESCIASGPINTMGSGPGRAARPAAATTAQAVAASKWNPYGSEAELKSPGLGYIVTPNGYTPGSPPWEIVGLYTDAFGRRGCDPSHNERGEEGRFYDTHLGQLGRGMPTDGQMAVEYGWTPDKGPGYMPVVDQMLPTADGRLLPLPWVPPDGWNPAGRSGPAPSRRGIPWSTSHPLGEITDEEARAHMRTIQTIQWAGLGVSIAVGLATIISYIVKR